MSTPRPRQFTPPSAPQNALPPWMRPARNPQTARERYEFHRRPSDPPWEALPDVARRGWGVAAIHVAAPTPAPVDTVWLTTATGGRTPDRTCDSLVTGQRLCDDFLAELSGEHTVVEDWANLNVPGAPERWVRYVGRGDEVIEQSVAASVVDVTGSWFRS